ARRAARGRPPGRGAGPVATRRAGRRPAARVGGPRLRGDRRGARPPHRHRALPTEPRPRQGAGGAGRRTARRLRGAPMTDDGLDPLRRLRPDLLLPDDEPADPAMLDRARATLREVGATASSIPDARRTPDLYPR